LPFQAALVFAFLILVFCRGQCTWTLLPLSHVPPSTDSFFDAGFSMFLVSVDLSVAAWVNPFPGGGKNECIFCFLPGQAFVFLAAGGE